MSGTYRKRPLAVHAIRVSEVREGMRNDAGQSLPRWLQRARYTGDVIVAANVVRVLTPSGVALAHEDDWLIHGVKGEVYPCRPDVFAETYELVTAEEQPT